LIVDIEAADRNIATAADYFRGRATKLRPHFKAHKCTALLARQVAAGSCTGVTCATAQEAEVLAAAGFTDVLVANQVVERTALQALGRAAGATTLAVAVDCVTHVELLAEALPQDRTVAVLIEIDVGNHRSGIAPGSSDLLRLAETIERTRNLRFVGLQAYEGHAVLERDFDVRRRFVQQAAILLGEERRRLEQAGVAVEVISGSGTGTFDLATDAGELTEIQAGSYVLMDATYDAIGLPFEIALYCCATIISRTGDRAVVDAGLKALSTDSGLPRAVDPAIETVGLADEHMRVRSSTATLPEVGERLLFVPSHVDPTVNLHDRIFTWSRADGISSWAIDGRRRQHDHA
jgi:D-serine deaminase-like pyridoxal phosphate-dependent protein